MFSGHILGSFNVPVMWQPAYLYALIAANPVIKTNINTDTNTVLVASVLKKKVEWPSA